MFVKFEGRVEGPWGPRLDCHQLVARRVILSLARLAIVARATTNVARARDASVSLARGAERTKDGDLL